MAGRYWKLVGNFIKKQREENREDLLQIATIAEWESGLLEARNNGEVTSLDIRKAWFDFLDGCRYLFDKNNSGDMTETLNRVSIKPLVAAEQDHADDIVMTEATMFVWNKMTEAQKSQFLSGSRKKHFLDMLVKYGVVTKEQAGEYSNKRGSRDKQSITEQMKGILS